ncbi:MAG: PP2C family serine/threonine-protein phosphatase [Varibaculum sp.]|nr:PP2C family serine/threonine-protein phosphatase [Varibaculum sp.]
MSIAMNYAARSDVGIMRSGNQDSGYAGPHLLVLADGMGGPAGGDIASSIAVAHLAPLDMDSHRAEELLDLLRGAIHDAHHELRERSINDKQLAGLGTTCIAILRSGNKLAMVHIGDSRAYLLRGGTLTQVTTDHSFVQYLVQTGQITPEEAEHHPKRSVLLRVLGDAAGDVTLDESIREAVPGDRWLLCSDGLSSVVSAETIGKVLHLYRNPDEACEQLIELALKAGGPDNVTCVVADIVESDDDTVATPLAPITVGAAATDRLAKTRGADTAAGKAAALTAKDHPTLSTDSPEETEDDQRNQKSRKKHLIAIFAALLLICGIGAGGYLALSQSQQSYWLTWEGTGTDAGVYQYQGLPQKLGPISLYRSREHLDFYTATRGTDKNLELLDNQAKRYLTETARKKLQSDNLHVATRADAEKWLLENSLPVAELENSTGSKDTDEE